MKRPGFPTLGDWPSYRRALQACDDWWKSDERSHFSVLAPSWSWRGVIAKLRHLVRRDWSGLSYTDQARLLGLVRDDEEDWALLGDMRTARPVVFGKQADRLDIESAVKDVLHADDADFPAVAIRAYQRIQRPGIAHGVATRLLAVARPDRVVSLNRGSVRRLAMYSGLLGGTLNEADNYEKLLHFVYKKPWFQTPVTDLRSDLDKEIWSMRAALLDSFVYTPERCRG